jgi:hypothetical protein
MPRLGAPGKVRGMNLKTFLVVPAAALALAAAGCGSDDEKKSDTAASTSSTPSTQQQQQQTPPSTSSDAPAGGEDAVKQVVLDWTFKGDCDLMTDKFLEAQAFVGDNRKERCDFFKKAYVKPQYKESDVKFRKVEVTGDKAVVTIGSDISNITTDYHLVANGGSWQIDEAS